MPVYPQAHAYDAVCEGADWVRNHEAKYVDVASVQVSSDLIEKTCTSSAFA